MSLLKGKQTLQLGEDVLIDVDPKSEFVNVRLGESKGSLVKKADLWAAIFTIADPETQERMMPVRQTTMETFVRIHRIKVTKPLKPGDTLNVKCQVSVEKTVVEGLVGSLTKPRPKGGILIPGK